MKQFFKTFFIVLLLALLILANLPENYPVKFKVGSLNIDTKINPLSINLSRFGLNVRKDFTTKLGLDLKGGSHLVFEADTSKLKPEDITEAITAARDTIERRVNYYGVAEPSVQTVKSGTKQRIVVDLPGVTNVSEAVGLIGRTAQLLFKEEQPTDDPALATAPAILRMTKLTGLTGRDVKKATVTFDRQTGGPQVALEFSDKGKKVFADVTTRNVGKQVVIFLDDLPISAPVVQTAILDGNAVINGNFTVDDAKKLAVAINSGALPVPIQLVEQRNIGPTLGASEIKKSVLAGIVGLLAVMLFMIIFYGRLGMIACLALIIYGMISFAIFRGIPIVLTLPGVAGFILSIGMAVDTNILIFERIKEELRKGQDHSIAVRLGFGRAIDAIKDANITTLLVAFILFNPLNWDFLPQFGLVRGFALTLAIGVATSLFTGIVITKRLINFFYKKS